MRPDPASDATFTEFPAANRARLRSTAYARSAVVSAFLDARRKRSSTERPTLEPRDLPRPISPPAPIVTR